MTTERNTLSATIIQLLVKKRSLNNCESRLLDDLRDGVGAFRGKETSTVPAHELSSTFSTRRDIEASRRQTSGAILWDGLDDLIGGLDNIREETPFGVGFDTDEFRYEIFYTQSWIGVICVRLSTFEALQKKQEKEW
jgi:hypothetical protein